MSAAEEAALDALAAALAPRVAKLLEREPSDIDNTTAEVLARAGFEIVRSANAPDVPTTRTKVAPKPTRKGGRSS